MNTVPLRDIDKDEFTKYGIYDIESHDWVHFVVMGFFDGETYRTFDSVGAFLTYIDKRKYRGYKFFAHNGGRFDFNFVVEELLNRYGESVKMIPRGGAIIAAYVDTGTTKYCLCDSYALLPESLKRLGDTFDTPHKKKEHDHEKAFNVRSARDMAYLENDCLCLHEVLAAFFDSEFCVKPQLTIASQALDTWRRKFLPAHELVRTTIEHETIFRENFYSGGRVEVYKGYSPRCFAYDVNSLYPFAMLNEMPVGECYETHTYRKGEIGFYRVRLSNTPDWYISPLLEKRNNSNYFVNGKGIYYLSSAMLDFLSGTFGVKFTVDWGLSFKRKEYLFHDYVTTFYDLKTKHKEKKDATYFISKYMLNSLYGKLGMGRFRESIRRGTPKLLESRPFDVSWLNEELGLCLVMEESHNRFILPYLAGYITELARLYHFRLMNLSPSAMLYCDTDSLYTEDPKTYLPYVGTRLGQLTYEGQYEGVFIAPKTYALKGQAGFESKIKFKGFNPKNFTFARMLKAARTGATLEETRDRVLSFRECVSMETVKDSKREITQNAGKYLKLARVKKKVSAVYDKRLTFRDGKRIFDTMPIEYKDLPKQKRERTRPDAAFL